MDQSNTIDLAFDFPPWRPGSDLGLGEFNSTDSPLSM